MTTKDFVSLPIVDLHVARDTLYRLKVAKQVVNALETVGFLYLDNVDCFEHESMLEQTHWFFNMSQTEKHRLARKLWNPDSQNHYRGYFPTQLGEPSFKEGFEIGQKIPPCGDIPAFFREPNLWPVGTVGADAFHQGMLNCFESLLECSLEMTRLVCLGSGLKEDWFQPMFFSNSLSTLRLLHYPPRDEVPEGARDGDNILSCSDHSDSGFITLLSTFGYTGLQIFNDGKWLSVPPRPNSIVMNIGDMLSATSGGRFKATRHRVLDIGADRFSVSFHLEPHYSADYTRVMPSEQNPQPSAVKLPVQSEQKCYGPYLMEKMKTYAEYKEMLASWSPPPNS